LAKKAVIIGIDGVPCSLLKAYMDQRIMPGLREIVAEGNLMPMRSTLPEVSSVAWTSFMTGEPPAEHSIFGFMEIDKNSYQYVFPNFTSIKSPLFWEGLNVPTIAFNIPQTYPARPMNGVMVSGFVAPDLTKAAYPQRVYDYLKAMDYRLDVNSRLAAEDPDAFFKDLFQTFEKRTEAIRHLFTSEDWRIFIAVITETDRLHHFFFDSAFEGRYHEVFADFYNRLDSLLRELFLRSKKDGAVFFTCSDHGFTNITTEVYVNRLLMEKGLLDLPSGATNLTGIGAGSTAFCLDPSRVYMHLKGKYSRGSVSPEDYEKTRNQVKDVFESLAYNGRKVVKKVFLKEEIFSGPYSQDAPDLYVMGEPGFDLKSSVGKNSVFGLSAFRGAHTYEDAHFLASGCTIPEDNISIENVAGLVLRSISED